MVVCIGIFLDMHCIGQVALIMHLRNQTPLLGRLTKSVGCVRHAAELQAVAHQGGVGVQLLCCFWSGCWAPPGIRALGVSAGGGGAVGLRQSGSLGCCVWPASRFCPPCNQQKIKKMNGFMLQMKATSYLKAMLVVQLTPFPCLQCFLAVTSD
jgi:hypothetical protein